MSHDSENVHIHKGARHGTIESYVVGFLVSLILTVGAYLVVEKHLLVGNLLILTVLGFAIAQFLVQVIFFLHLNREARPRWKSKAFMFTFMTVIIIVAGSLWIMNHLNYNMMPTEMDSFILHDEGMEQ